MVTSPRLVQRRRARVRSGKGGRVDYFETLKPYTHTWWGRVGELLFLALYPEASDSVIRYGNRCAYDAEHPVLGRVSVKTAVCKDQSWSFLVTGCNRNSDTAFFVGFDSERRIVERAWQIPAHLVPSSSKTLTPESREYSWKSYEVATTITAALNEHLNQILGSVGTSVQREGDPSYDRVVWGRIGEAIYKTLHPLATHVSAVNQFSPHDFVFESGKTVNVRLRRLGADNRWGFFRSNSTADEYCYIGLDRLGEKVLSIFEVPGHIVPKKGFSYRWGSSSKWDSFLLGTREDPMVFILWGAYAKSKRPFIEAHPCVLDSPHPSPFSSYQGFFGSKPFSKANAFLESVGKTPVDWAL